VIPFGPWEDPDGYPDFSEPELSNRMTLEEVIMCKSDSHPQMPVSHGPLVTLTGLSKTLAAISKLTGPLDLDISKCPNGEEKSED